ncbi:MAG: GNAT family N-acetyltransferase [Nocardioides sp.]|nr:GNAT family N-acetyltransferase [Nocardioides sp.]
MVPALASPAPSGGDRDLTGTVLVAVADDGPAGPGPVGFAHLSHQDSWGEWAHLEQLSVLPTHQGRGVGRALVEAARERARWDGHRRLSLCTYRDVPWNGPFYRSAGFEEVDEAHLQPFQAALRAREQELGLDGAGPRCVMMVTLARKSYP